jgi:mono/diheme cytochrome c family protein
VGEADFKGFGCVRCHRVGEEGGTYGPDLTFVGFRKSKDWLDLWLKNPHAWRAQTAMPNFHLPDEIRKDLVEYLSNQQGQAFGEKRPWDEAELQGDLVKKGEVIFNRAGCVACHGLRGAGGYPNNNAQGGKIPTLTLVADGYSKDELKDRIRKGKISDPADPSQPAPMIRMPPWGQKLKDSDIDALVEFLYSLRPKQAAAESW